MDIVAEANFKAPLVRPHTEFVLIYYLTMPNTWKVSYGLICSLACKVSC